MIHIVWLAFNLIFLYGQLDAFIKEQGQNLLRPITLACICTVMMVNFSVIFSDGKLQGQHQEKKIDHTSNRESKKDSAQ